MPFLHLPIQSGSDQILKMMNRKHTRAQYLTIIDKLRTVRPDIALSSDFIVGFPGETEEDFKETFEFLHDLDISYLHVFTYSERDNTKALEIKPVVPINIRHERNKILRNLSYMKMQHFTNLHNGQTRKVLFEGFEKNNMMEGYTDNYIRITTPYRTEWANQIVDWNIQ